MNPLKDDNHFIHIPSEQILDQVVIGVYWKNVKGIYLGCNHFFSQLAGLASPKDIQGKTDLILPWREQRKLIQNNEKIILESGQTNETEETLLTADGSVISFRIIRSPIKNHANEIIGIIGNLINISDNTTVHNKYTDLEKINFYAKLSNELTGSTDVKMTADDYGRYITDYLEKIIACMPGNVYWLDKNSVFLGCNDNVAKMLGLQSRSEIIGLTHSQTAKLANWTEGQAESFARDDKEVIITGIPKVNVEEPPITDIDGNIIRFLTTRVPIKDPKGDVIGVVGISIDITDRKRVEESLQQEKLRAESANQAKSYFMASIGHEFRTPINNILGLSDFLRKNVGRIQTAELESYYDIIHQCGSDLLDLINDVILFSRIEMGYFKIENQIVNLQALIEKVVSNNRHRADVKLLQLKIEYPDNIPLEVIGDLQRIRQILTNLIDNALKFTHEGTITVQVKIDENKQSLYIAIIDTGIGIAEEKLSIVFERFSQVHTEYTDQRQGRYRGIGLGLAIVKQLVELMGGNVGVHSVLGKGSTFFFTLPIANKLVDQTTLSSANNSEILDVVPNIEQTPKILLVEDNNIAQKVAQLLFKQCNCNYDIAANGKIALEYLQKNHYQLVFMDLGLPDISGLEVTEQFRKIEKVGSHINIIALTAQGLDEGSNKAISAGMDDYIEKPLTEKKLKMLLHKFVH